MVSDDIIFGFLLLIAVIVTTKTRKLSNLGGVAAAIVATCIYIGTGFNGISLLALFFVLGVAATRWKRDEKRHIKVVEEHQEERNAKQVLANGGVAALLGIACTVFPEFEFVFYLMLACSLSAATADTLSSELGMVYGKRFYNILSWKADTRGENGVISIEGTLIGIAGSVLIAVLYAATSEWNIYTMMIVIVAGTIGNIADSILGATLERHNMIGNNAVNALNTFIAALVGALLA
jgi:uncharacterized protein (TIGR00297 family)